MKALIIYFSRADENYAVGYIDKGNTEIVAEYVQEMTGADMFKVEPAVPYSADYQTCIEEAKKRVGNAPIKEKLSDISAYDTVFIMSPIYWGTYAPEVETAIEGLDFSGKTVTPASFAGDTGSIISAAAQKYNVDPKLVAAIAQTESGGNQAAVSSAGAVGIMQLMPDTAAALGVDPYNKQQNIDGGTKYIRQMLDTFNGDVKKAVAAYNAGPQAVKDYDGVPPYQETQNYVNKVLDIYR